MFIGVNDTGVKGSGPPMFDLQGPVNVMDPAIIPAQSRVRCTIFVNDFMVSAVVVEQVHGSTFTFCLLKMQDICPLKRFIFNSR